MGLLGFGEKKEETRPVAEDVNKQPGEIEQQSETLQDGAGNPIESGVMQDGERSQTNDVILEMAGDRLIKKEVSMKRGDDTPVAFMYTRVDGSTFEVAAESLLVAQLDEKLDKQAVVSQEEVQAAQNVTNDGEYAKPEYQVTDTNGNVLRSYNVGIHGEKARYAAEQYAAKVNGIVKEII